MAENGSGRDFHDAGDPRLTQLDRRLEQARRDEAIRQGTAHHDADAGYSLGNRVLAALIGSLVGSALIGWLLLSGPLTALPLLLFAAGVRRISLTTLGVLQYIGPTIQFLLGVALYHEPFGGARLAGFALIWTALVIYSGEGWWRLARRPAATA